MTPLLPSVTVPAWLLRLPVWVAILAAALHLQNHPGLFVPDTVNFLGEGVFVGYPTYPVIPPAYPALLDLICFSVPRPARMFVLVLLQQLGVVLTVWFTVRIGTLAARPLAGVVAGSLVAAYLPLYSYAQTSQSESLYTAYCMGACWFAVRGWVEDRTKDFVWAGALAGLAIAQRTVGYAIVAAALVAMLLGRTRARWMRCVSFLVPLLLVAGLFVAKNFVHHGHAILVGGTGLHLFGRIAMVDKVLPDTPAAARLRETSARHGKPDPLFQNAGWALQGWMQGDGVPAREADRELTKVALQVHTSQPLRSLWLTLREMASMVRVADPLQHMLWNGLRPENFEAHTKITDDVWGPWADKLERMRPELAPYPGQPLAGAWVYDFLEGWAWFSSFARGIWVIPAMVLLWAFGALRRHPTLLLLAGLPFAQMFLTAVGDQPYERYWDPCVVPFLLALVVGLSIAVDLWRQRRKMADHSLAGLAETAESPVTELEPPITAPSR